LPLSSEKSKILPMARQHPFHRSLVLLTLTTGCVTEAPKGARDRSDPFSEPLPAGSYHGVNLYFEVAPEDRPYEDDPRTAAEWLEEPREGVIDLLGGIGRLPAVLPRIEPGGREVYALADHRVVYEHGMFEVGGYRYPRLPGAHLYVYKKRQGNFEFFFRNQRIVVPSDITWIPSVFHSSSDEAAGAGKLLTREVLQVGLATIETEPAAGVWLVNGRRFHPDPLRPLELTGAVHAATRR